MVIILFFMLAVISVIAAAVLDNTNSRVGAAVCCIIFVVATVVVTWASSQESLATRTCVATVTAEEGWAEMSIADLRAAAEAAMATQPVSVLRAEQAESACFERVKAKALPETGS